MAAGEALFVVTLIEKTPLGKVIGKFITVAEGALVVVF
jgi:hypothetical protein